MSRVRSTAARRRRNAKRSPLARWRDTWHSTERDACMFCGRAVRRVPVVGSDGRVRHLSISTNPKRDGRVYRTLDGQWRMLPLGARRYPDVAFYDLHGYLSCSDEARWLGDVPDRDEVMA